MDIFPDQILLPCFARNINGSNTTHGKRWLDGMADK